VFKIHIAQRLSGTLHVTLEHALAGVDYGKKGEDFTVASPDFLEIVCKCNPRRESAFHSARFAPTGDFLSSSNRTNGLSLSFLPTPSFTSRSIP
jgi:hypothetical protein